MDFLSTIMYANAVIQQSGDVKPEDISEGKAYIQELYWDFNSR